jgi:hypothetical protein
VLVKKKLTLLTRMRPRTEPSLSQDPSQFSKPFKRSRLDKQERTAKEDQRNRPFAKLTMPKVVLELVKNALLLQYAHQTFNQVETFKEVVEKALVYTSEQTKM